MSVITVVLLAPLVVIWVVGVVGMLRRDDLAAPTRLVWAVVMVLLPPLAILHLWSRPTRLIGRDTPDWRDGLVDTLENEEAGFAPSPDDAQFVGRVKAAHALSER